MVNGCSNVRGEGLWRSRLGYETVVLPGSQIAFGLYGASAHGRADGQKRAPDPLPERRGPGRFTEPAVDPRLTAGTILSAPFTSFAARR
jgi:hypothetical protein